MRTKWYVVTGAPSSGITTLVLALRPYVYRAFRETARALIDRNLRKGIGVAKTRADEAAFQRKVLRMKLEREARAPKNRVCVFDRGLPDSIPYFVEAGLDPEPLRVRSRGRYRLVFYLEPLPYRKDYARTETRKAREWLGRQMLRTYKDLGYKVVRVPAVSVKERLNIVLSCIGLRATSTTQQLRRARHS